MASHWPHPWASVVTVCCLASGIPAAVLLLGSGSWATQEEARWAVAGYAVLILLGFLIAAMAFPNRPRIGFLMLLFAQVFWFAIPALDVALSEEWFGEAINQWIAPEEVLLATILLGVFATVSCVACMAAWNRWEGPGRVLPIRNPDVESSAEGRALRVALPVLLLVGLMPMILYGESLRAVFGGVLESRSAGKGWSQAAFESNPVYVLGRASLVSVGLVALYRVVVGRGLRLAWGLLFGFAFLLTYLDSGTRTWTALIVAPALVLLARRAAVGRRALQWVLLSPVIVLILLGLAALQRSFRDTGWTREHALVPQKVPLDNDFFVETAFATSLVPDKIPFVRESVTVLFLTNPVPRALWTGKPHPRVIEQYGLSRSGYNEFLESGLSRMPSVVGQFYMSWGGWGVVLIAIELGLLVAWLDSRWDRQRQASLVSLWMAACSVWIFVSFRGVFPGFHYPLLLLAMILWYEHRVGRRASAGPIRGMVNSGDPTVPARG